METGTLFDDRYRIVRQLAAGGMGVVYEAEHQHTRRRVAIKCLHPEMTLNKEIVARFQREATAAAAIGNEHIIDVLDMARRADGAFYMVLEFLNGRDLATALREDGPFSVRRAVHVVTQVCAALEAAHQKGIVHRDLKPENLFLLTRDNDPDYVKVLDFGISKFRDGDEGAGASTPLTRTGSLMGTPHYMAPEQIRSTRDVDHRADIFALGVITYQLLAGAVPFDDATVHLLIYRISALPPASLSAARPDLPPALVACVERMLAKAPSDRFQSCAEVRDVLSPFASWVGDAPTHVERPAQAPVSFEPTRLSAVPAAIPDGPGYTLATVPPLVSLVPGPPARARWPMAALVVVALLGALAVWRLGASPADSIPRVPTPAPTPRAPAAPPEPASTPVPSAAPAPVPAPSAAAPAARTRVQLATTPDDAEVLLDGRRIANPFDGELPASSENHRLEIRRAGYTTVVQDLSLEFPQVIRVRLRHGHGVEDRRRNAAREPAPTAASAHASPTPEPAPAPSTPVLAPPTPGAVVPPPQQPLRHIEL